jgi:hypothetical protein
MKTRSEDREKKFDTRLQKSPIFPKVPRVTERIKHLFPGERGNGSQRYLKNLPMGIKTEKN